MRILFVLAIAIILGCFPAAAQTSLTSLSVRSVTSTESCTYFQETAGAAALAANRRSIAMAAAWRTWWVKDCVQNFATMRSTLEAALAAAPGLTIVGRNGRYAVALNITQVSDADIPMPTAPTQGRIGIATAYVMVSFDLKVVDGSGRSVFGTLMTKKMEIGSDVRADDVRASSVESGDAVYGRLQNEIALAAARAIAFHFTPMVVLSNDGRDIQLNYGSPFLKLGDLVLASSLDRRDSVRYRVISATTNNAIAEHERGDGRADRIVSGSPVSFVEADDPMQNGRRFRRNDLP